MGIEMRARSGHVIINDEGEVAGLDQAFGDMMHSSADAMRGRRVVDVTAPGDRKECAAAIERLRDTGAPFSITKRLVRDDGSLIWVRNTVSLISDGSNRATIVATIEPLAGESEARDPARLLKAAQALVQMRRARAAVCDPALFSEPGWDTILASYIAEAQGRAITVSGLAEMLDHSESVVSRWLAALVQHDVLEIETRAPSPDGEKPFRLTGRTHQRLEAYLDQIDRG